jgi:NAD(P)-dependent dehydrogenase (short-subunit alcohol dehydrogenase family)
MNVIDMFRLNGKVALITGGARHLGNDMANALAEAGADLVITSRTLSSAEASAEKLNKEHGVEVLPLELDQSKHENVSQAVAKAHAWKGHIDILINNAGGGGGSGSGPAHLFKRDPKEAEDLIIINLIGALHCCQEVAKLMAEQKSGKIINIASIAGIVGRDRRMYERLNMNGQPVDYAAAKGGVMGMTLDLAGLLSPMGICVNAISPGGFTGPTRGMSDEFTKAYSDRTPTGHMGRDEIDIKGAALFLASPASDYVTGQNLVVDGGFSIWQ